MLKESQQLPTLRGTAADILKAKSPVIHAIAPTATVYDAIAKMCEARVGPKLLGILSERDYARKVILLGRASKETRVEEIMTTNVISVESTARLGQCMQVVTQHSIRHLPVVDQGHVAGVLSTGDLVRSLLEQQADTIQSLKSFIGSDYPS